MPSCDISFDKGLSDGFRGHVWWPGPGIEPLSYTVGFQEAGVRNPKTEPARRVNVFRLRCKRL